MLHFLCSAVVAQWFVVAMEHDRTYMMARTRAKNPPSHQLSVVPTSPQIMHLDFKIFDSESLITEVEERPALYN